MADERLSQFLKEGKGWERKATSIPGVFLIKLPEYKSRPPYIALEVNPVDTSGIATKRRGILIRSRSELEQISNILTNAKIIQLAASLDEVNPEKKTKPLSTETDVYEIWNKKENNKNGQGQLRFAQLVILANTNSV